MRGICPITKCEDDIRKSHIYPKFLWKHLKRTGGTVFRSVDQPLKSATLLKSQSVAAQTAKNAIFLVWTDFLPCVG